MGIDATARSRRRGRVEKGSDSPAVGKLPLERQREGVAWKKRRRGRPEKLGPGLGSIAQYSSLGRTRAPENSGSRRGHESTLPSFLCVLARGTVRSRHCSTRRRTRSAGGSRTARERDSARQHSLWVHARELAIALSKSRINDRDGGQESRTVLQPAAAARQMGRF